jgi:hypothetical protein
MLAKKYISSWQSKVTGNPPDKERWCIQQVKTTPLIFGLGLEQW